MGPDEQQRLRQFRSCHQAPLEVPSVLSRGGQSLNGSSVGKQGYDWVRSRPELAAEAPIGALKSPKSRLQEFTQRRTGERPSYRLTDASGPDHERSFRIEVWIDGELMGVGEGPSRRAAETVGGGSEVLRRLQTGSVRTYAASLLLGVVMVLGYYLWR